jgi:hypothetical protein
VRRHLFLIVPVVVVAAFAGYGLLSRGGGPGSGCGGYRFDPVAWRQGSDAAQTGRLSPRWRQAERLDRCGTLTGLSARRVGALLGAPRTRSRRAWLYALGYDLGDLQFLEVRFGADGRVGNTTAP